MVINWTNKQLNLDSSDIIEYFTRRRRFEISKEIIENLGIQKYISTTINYLYFVKNNSSDFMNYKNHSFVFQIVYLCEKEDHYVLKLKFVIARNRDKIFFIDTKRYYERILCSIVNEYSQTDFFQLILSDFTSDII